MASTIKAKDFNTNTADKFRDRWTGADMAHVVEALNGETVLVEVDRQTGYTVMGKLVRVSPGYHESPRLLIAMDTNPKGIAYRVWDLGNIVVLNDRSNAKWRALELQREAHAAVSKAAYERISEKCGGEPRGWIRYVGLNPGEYMAKYEPYQSDSRTPIGRSQYANVSV